MKYKIYELEAPEHLIKHEEEGYYVKKIERNLLIEVDLGQQVYDSMEAAFQAIETNKNKLKFKQLTILPSIYIDWEGDIN